MIFNRNSVFAKHFIKYNYFLVKFLCKTNFDNTGEKHIIHFMGFPIVFFKQKLLFFISYDGVKLKEKMFFLKENSWCDRTC